MIEANVTALLDAIRSHLAVTDGEPRACEFCGIKGGSLIDEGSAAESSSVYGCDECGACGPLSVGHGKRVEREAVARWNTRTSDPLLQRAVEEIGRLRANQDQLFRERNEAQSERDGLRIELGVARELARSEREELLRRGFITARAHAYVVCGCGAAESCTCTDSAVVEWDDALDALDKAIAALGDA